MWAHKKLEPKVLRFFIVRIKGLASIKREDALNVLQVLLFSVSSDGVLKAWSFQDGKVSSISSFYQNGACIMETRSREQTG